ncbi:hypothetical protein ONZ51_g7284 [Trametes cubensis]|uniref:Peptidase A1 domain-containing protein n=1 Tax=Trametes cubensis TaxID=1111947 RepID=A0AAD7X9P6_9APHY|nr:hypothetical protein ONZ51_g7284 [Trametes cubensis]
MYCRSLITFLLSLSFASALVALVYGTPVVKVDDNMVRMPIAKLLNFTTGSTSKILVRDQARFRNFRLRTNASSPPGGNSPYRLDETEVGTIVATDQVVDYVVEVDLTDALATDMLLVDTGSANTWVGASQPYAPAESNSSVATGQYISVHYGSGRFSGIQYNDTVSVGGTLNVTNQGIGAANTSSGFQGVDGILGQVSVVNLTIGTLSPDAAASVSTITDNLFQQGVISSNQVAITFVPSHTIGSINGELAFGGTDSDKYIGNITYAPIATSPAARSFFSTDQSITYGSQSLPIMNTTSGIVDTGTTLTLIPSNAFAAYQNATGAVMDSTTNMLSIPATEYDNLQSLFFTIDETTFEFTPNAQIWPRALNTAIGGTAENVYLIIGDAGEFTSEGINFVNGMTFLERFYAVFYSPNSTVGLANTLYTNSIIN